MQESKRELKKGYISAINGSLIHIKGFQGQNFQEHVRLHDLVKVDKQNIMGEIIQIYSKYVAAQCFENTDNLKLYQEVTYLNEPLSMELGPGLLSNVFDGIQRPLDKIFEKAKSGFLERGVEIPSLSRTKKWHFKPTKKEGEKVVSGDVVGIVQETPAITHYIMIPNGISGEISYIVDEGEYTVTENIYNIKTEKDEKKFDMIQKWPVTKNRPFSKKLSPTRPLITGQRVVDLLFPVAKGGTVAVPGGFGTGKCVVGDTPVLLSNGSLVEIKKLYKKYKKNDGEININSREETLIRIQNDLEVLSLNSINFKPEKATHIYHGKTNQIIKIGTRTGRKIRLTPIHKLHVFDGNKILTKMAKDLAENDYILVPRKIKINEQSISFSAYDMDDSLRVYDEYALEKMRTLLDKIYKTNTKKEIAKKLNIKYNQLQQYWNATNKPPIKFFKKVSQVFKEDPIKISLIKAERQSKPFKIPQNLTPELSEWLGLFVADGHIKGTHGGIFLYNTSEQILERFKKLSEVIFNLEVSYGGDSDERTPYMVIRNTSLRKFLYMLGIPKKNKTKTVKIPNCILKSSESILKHFLNGYFAGDGWFSKYTVGFSTISKKLHINLCYVLSRLGLLYRVSTKNNLYYIELEGKRAEKFAILLIKPEIFKYDKLKPLFQYTNKGIKHFDSLDVIPYNKELFKKLKAQGRDSFGHNTFRKIEGIRLDNYIKKNQSLTLDMLKKINDTIEKYNLDIDIDIKKFIKYILDISKSVYFDKIKNIEVLNKKIDVYDLTVNQYHNFIGGNQPIILHNTVLQQSIAKWSDANVIVFVSCGERGNEVADVLEQFAELIDPRTNRPLLERIVLIANTSNMPVSAREASIFSGITIAEYYRDMGYDVALQADSTSRWAEALREISGLLEEMPAEAGYPAYLPSRLSGFYERAGIIETIGKDNLKKDKIGSLTVIGSVSPPAGDFSEPVTANTKRFVQSFWALDAELAYQNHYPAINWLESYSNYPEYISEWWNTKDIDWSEVDLSWIESRNKINNILSRENELRNMTQLVGEENLPEDQQLDLFIANIIKEGLLVQNAFDAIDNYTSAKKLLAQVKLIILLYNEAKDLLREGKIIREVKEMDVINDILRIKTSIPNDEISKITQIKDKLLNEINSIKRSYEIVSI